MHTQLGLGSVVGWRIRQAGDQGIGALLHELAKRPADAAPDDASSDATGHLGDLGQLLTDPTALGAIEAAIRLHREDLVALTLAALSQPLADPATLDQLGAHESPVVLGALIRMLTAVVEQLEGPAAEAAATSLELICTRTVSRIGRLRRLAELPDDADDDQREASRLGEMQLAQLIVLAPALAQAANTINAPDTVTNRTRSAVRSILQAVAGDDFHRVSMVGGNAQRIMHLLEAMALLAGDPRRKHIARSAVELFDEISFARLYVTGAVAQQPHGGGQDIVRPFGATHTDGIARPCTTLGWIRALIALRPIMASVDRQGEIDAMLELVTHNALLVAVGTDPTRWFGPVPHGLDRTEEMDLFGEPDSHHRFAPGPWRPNMRAAGEREQCCAVSTLLGLSLVPDTSVHSQSDPPDQVIEIGQLSPSETTGEGWELSITGDWPFSGEVAITMRTDHSLTLKVRVPDWHPSARATQPNPTSHKVRELPDETETSEPTTWITVPCEIGVTETHVDFPPTPRLIHAHPLMSDVKGCVALLAGPFVFCLEGADQMGHLQPRQVRFDADGAVTLRREVDHPESTQTIHATGDWQTPWTRTPSPGRRSYRLWIAEGMGLPVDVTFVPFYSIANRGYWDVAIWLPLATSTDSAN